MINITMCRLQEALLATGRGKTAFYGDITDGLMTRAVKIGEKASAWPSYEIEAINAARIRDASKKEIQALVRELHEKRKNLNVGVFAE